MTDHNTGSVEGGAKRRTAKKPAAKKSSTASKKPAAKKSSTASKKKTTSKKK